MGYVLNESCNKHMLACRMVLPSMPAQCSTSRVPVDATSERGVLEVKPWRISEPDATGEGVVVIEERDDGQVREVAHVVGESVGGSRIGSPVVRRCVGGTLRPMLLSAIEEA